MDKNGPLKDIIKKVISDLEKKEEVDILKIWEKVVGAKAAKHARPTFFRSKKLIIKVSDSAWLYKLTLEKGRLIEKLNNDLMGKTKKMIKELQFRIGEVDNDS